MNELKLPFYVQLVVVLLGISLFILFLVEAGAILRPLLYAVFFALLLHPLCTRFERWKLSRTLSALFCVLIPSSIIGAVLFFISSQFSTFSDSLPVLQDKINLVSGNMMHFLETKLHVTNDKLMNYLNDSVVKLLDQSGTIVSYVVTSISSSFISFFLFSIYLFFTLYYRRECKQFILDIFQYKRRELVEGILTKIQLMVRSYVTGVLIVVVIVGVLNSLGLLILGVEYAIFFGVLASILNLIPYIGILIGALVTMLFTLITKESIWPSIGAGLIFLGVHLLEANVITPKIVGSKVNLNPFSAVLGLIIWHAIWGISGMVLAIPLVAMFKIICDAVDPLKPIGALLGKSKPR